ncbi:ketoreductase [Saccharomonospora piscinae]|uniref:Ketoreductase n=1 Tax=Saccharomonospora piscinae TaxID=687388 RepID=A0A1V9ACC3_SACPI|nr:SDR family oxidoreductase [Saccharomonospora piscinae]OQO94688.1 ketoreductase [Saccharomonospora piscinae]
MSLEGKTVLITGAGTGIGAAAAIDVAAAGASTILVGRRESVLDATAGTIRERGGDALVLPADLTRPGDVDDAAATVLERFGGLDGLVNNAGVGRFAPIHRADPSDLQFMFDLHVRAPVQLIQRFVATLREREGAIVNVTSVAGQLAAPNRSFYGATKAAITHLTRSLAKELAPAVRVNAILPGPVDTPIYDELDMSSEQMATFRAELEAATPIGRFGRSEEVAPWVTRLLDDSAGWVTGVQLPIDGGRCV